MLPPCCVWMVEPRIPATAGATGAAYANDLVSFVTQYESEAGAPVPGSLTPAQTWTILQTLPESQQQLLVSSCSSMC